MKICFAASSGGHLEEISCLDSLIKQYDSFLVTEYTGDMDIKNWNNKYFVKQINRKEPFFFFYFLKLFIISFKIYLNEKPDYVISTGALATVPICIIAKLFRKKIIYIESFARVEKPSLTGRILYKFADLFIVQWEELLQYYPKATLTGSIF